jgi:hypothetical protein
MFKILKKQKLIFALSLILILNSFTNINSETTAPKKDITRRNATNFKYIIPGINWPNSTIFINFQKQIRDAISIRNDSSYNPYTFNLRTNLPKPAVIVTPKDSSEIITAIDFARNYNLKISVQSTGRHPDVRNIQDNSVHIVLKKFKNAFINRADKTLKIGTGLNFGEIHDLVNKETNGTLFALCPMDNGMGPYSFYTGGGRGAFSKAFGLGVDALLNVEMLKFNGEIVQANSNTNKDLFNAFRGATGSSFGIVLSITVKLFNSPNRITTIKGTETFFITPSQFTLDYLSSLPNEVSYFYKISNDGSYKTAFSAVCVGNSASCTNSVEKLKSNCKKVDNGDCVVNDFNNVYDYLSKLPNDKGGKKFYTYSSYFSMENYSNGIISAHFFVNKNNRTECEMNAVIGGATKDNKVSSDFSISSEQRNSFMEVFCTANLDEVETIEAKAELIDIIDKFGDEFLSIYSRAVYWNRPTHNFAKDDWKERYWGGIETYNRLLNVKNVYDPYNIFTCYHCIGYDYDFYGPEPALCGTSSCSCSNNVNGTCSIKASIINNSGFGLASLLSYKILVFLFFFILN